MVNFFAVVVLLTFFSIVVALVRPKAILWKVENPTRKHAVSLTMVGFVISVFVWVSLLHEEANQPVATSSPAVPQVEAPKPVPAVVAVAEPEPLPPGMEEKIISLASGGLVSGVKNHAPRLAKVAEEKRGPVVVETYRSEPSKVTLTLETLPGHGLLADGAALLKAKMIRPLEDKPSPYDGGLANTLDAFTFFAAPNWHGAEQKAFVGECLMTLLTQGCDSTMRNTRVVAKRFGTDQFVIEAFRP